MSPPDVAICIPTYNQAHYLEAAVESAIAQTHPCEVWVSDDASTDETPVIMERLLVKYPQVRYIRHKQNLGMSGNSSWVVQQPLTSYVVKLDSDDELHSIYVETLLKALMKQPSAGYAHGAVQEIDGDGRKLKIRLLARSSGVQNGEDSLRASVTGFRVAANICMFRRTALKQVDYYRKDGGYACDWDLAVRFADAGWGNSYVSKVLANYRVWDTSSNFRSRRKTAEVEGCYRVIEDSLIPAYARRHWSLTPIAKARRQLALRHAECLRSNQYSETERNGLRQALSQLGDSAALKWKFLWIRTPFAPLFQLPVALKAYTKSRCKTFLLGKAQ